MTISQNFYIYVSGFVFAGMTVIFGLAFLSQWPLAIGDWELAHNLLPLAALISFLLTIGAFRLFR